MRGYTTDFVNLIADNLRDRYENGFPILKELIQNADDAKARTLIFSSHPGFPDASNPLLKGKGFWCFNDGEFKTSDVEDLRSFGFNSKAGDTRAIGKFGLGMKSVFHLCEALFYVAWDGKELHREGLTPWKRDDHMPHPEWDETGDDDWALLEDLGRVLADRGDCSEFHHWFLLWTPLRSSKHLKTQSGEESGAIIGSFPGDDPSGELAFLDDANLARDVAETLPLLRHLERVEHRGENNRFALQRTSEPRLTGEPHREGTCGQVLVDDGQPLLGYSGRRQVSSDPDGHFAHMKTRVEWPRTRYRDEWGQERLAEDKTAAEAAVLLCSDRVASGEPRSRLQWAVFLPVEDNCEDLRIDGVQRGFSLILHGQFFLDSGRKKLHGLVQMHEEPSGPGDGQTDESRLRTEWNQKLAQHVVVPLVLPVVDDHARQHALSDDECAALAKAISDSNWFNAFRRHVCRDCAWLRMLQPDGDPQWRLICGDRRLRLRPFPKPPKSAQQRPWKVFPELATCDVVAYDVNAAYLDRSDKPGEWTELDLEKLLSRVDGLLADAPSIDYLTEFLDSCAGRHRSSKRIQHRLLVALRHGFQSAGLTALRQVATKARRLIDFLDPERRVEIAAELPESVLRGLWEIDAPVLLVPKGMAPEQRGICQPDERTVADWMRVLDRALDSTYSDEERSCILGAAQGLLKTLAAEARGRFLRDNRALRIVEVHDARTGLRRPASFELLNRLRNAGTLFGFAEGLQEATRLGIAPLLARAIPGAEVCLIRAQTYRELFSGDGTQGRDSGIPAASNGQACLAAVGRLIVGRLGEIADRRKLLEGANDSGMDADARRGLRLLLHGSLGHRMDDRKLWIGRHNQHPAWSRLWDAMHEGAQWSRIREELADAIPRTRWSEAKIDEIEARTLLDELRRTGRDIEAPSKFSEEEREEILSRVEYKDLWLRLPLHTTLDRVPVTADRERIYLAPDTACREDPLIGEVILIAPSQNPVVAEQQRRWLSDWDDRARIEVALEAHEPSLHWRSVMDALKNLPPPIHCDIRNLLRGKAWLPTVYSVPVKPEDVIDFQGAPGDEAHRLVAKHRSDHGPCFAVPGDIDAEVRDHPAWKRLSEEGFSSGLEGLESLDLLLQDLLGYKVGTWHRQPNPDEVELLSLCEELPGWRLLETVADEFGLEDAWRHLQPALSKQIEAERLVMVLSWLCENNDQWEPRKSVHDTYLRQLASHHQDARDHLPSLHLASVCGQWRDSSELCTGVHGVVHAALLDTTQADILGDLVCREGAQGEQAGRSEACLDVRFQTARDAAPEILRDYFRAWGSGLVPRAMIGVLLGLMGSGMRELVEEYVHPHSFEWFVERLPWGGAPSGTLRQHKLESIQAGVQVETGEEVEVRNLLGQPLRVALDREARTLLAGAVRWQGTDRVMIPLRRIDPDRLVTKQLHEVIRATAEQLSREIYNQADANFGALWQELEESDQLEVRVARRLILDHLPFYLRQLSVKGPQIEEYLAICDAQRRRIAEIEADGQPTESARKALNQALDALAACIDQDPEIQQTVVQAVRGRLEQYQYEPSSIPFELFQNADDAAVQSGLIHAYPSDECEVPPDARRFVVDERTDGLRFLHWGRPVNDRGPVGFDGQHRGYDRDLENMLVLSATDKHDGEAVTGKFGLGFKSVLLACEQPRIVSGRLAVRVVAGILPQPWEEAQETRQRLAELGGNARHPGTLIDLPGVRDELRDGILERFRRMSGILCVFARAIRSISFVAESGTKSPWTWQPKQVCSGVETGDLYLEGDWGAHTAALCIRTDSGSLLMALEPRGFRPLPDTAPSLWVTAPTSEPSAVGFAVNGSFDLDAGRGRLASSTTNNLEIARSIGREAGESLGVLLMRCQRCERDWAAIRAALSLAADCDPVDFWESIWLGLTQGWRSSGAALEHEIVVGVLTRLCMYPKAVPNGLGGSLRAFSNASDIRYVLSEELRRQDIEATLVTWSRFTARYSAQNCVSEKIGNILQHAGLCDPQALDIAELVAMLERSRVEPIDAEVLGRLRLLTEDAPDWASDSLRNRLNELQFQSEAGEWVESRKLLLAPHGIESDAEESRRHALAPPENRLRSDYYVKTEDDWPAITFFRVCRQRMEAPTEKLAQWVLNAESEKMRLAALEYLADGEHGERVAEKVRGQAWLASALDHSALMARLTEVQRDRLRRRLVSAADLKQISPTDSSEWQAQGDSHVDLPTALERLHQWWSANRRELAEAYRNRLYPVALGPLDLEPDPETGRYDRSSWLMLFALGSFQSIGRTKEEQHSGFIQHCRGRGWWGVFADHDPKEAPERWMDIIEEYAEDQHDDEEWALWLAQFPKLYRLRRWLDDYVELFRSIDQYEERLVLDTILAPRSNPHFQGGGIDAPPLTRTLKLGSHLVIRELLHHGVIKNSLAVPHAYAPIQRVQEFFRTLGAEVSTSEDIHQLLNDHLGEDRATFCGDYDIPLRLISSDDYDSLRRKLLLESKLEFRFIEALRRIEVEDESVQVVEDLGGGPGFHLTTAGHKYFMEPQPEIGADEGVTVPSRPDFVIRAAQESGEQPFIAVFMDGFKHHRDRTDEDTVKRMALVRAGHLVWSLTWHDLDAVLGDGDAAAELLCDDSHVDNRMAQRQRDLDARWSTGRIRAYLAEPSLELLVRYLQNPDVTQWRRAVFTGLLRLFQPGDMQSEALRSRYIDAIRRLPAALQDGWVNPPQNTVFAGRGRWRDTPPNFTELFLALPRDALEHADPTGFRVALHLDDTDTTADGYQREWNGVLRLYNLLQFLPNACWTTARGVRRSPHLAD